MKYLMLMYRRADYWASRSDERDQREERAFADFCGWMRDQDIEWESFSLTAPDEVVVASSAAELVEVVAGGFLLTIPAGVDPDDVAARCPFEPDGRTEVRQIEQ